MQKNFKKFFFYYKYYHYQYKYRDGNYAFQSFNVIKKLRALYSSPAHSEGYEPIN